MKTFNEFMNNVLTQKDINSIVRQLHTVTKKLGYETFSDDDDKSFSPSKKITSVAVWVQYMDDDSAEPIGKFVTDGTTFQWINVYSKTSSGKAVQGISAAKNLIKQILLDHPKGE